MLSMLKAFLRQVSLFSRRNPDWVVKSAEGSTAGLSAEGFFSGNGSAGHAQAGPAVVGDEKTEHDA
jgi:hypothetical protein